MRKMFHFMDDPHQMITRSGDLFYFSKWDEKKQKMFISSLQSLHGRPMIPTQPKTGTTNFMGMLNNMASTSTITLTSKNYQGTQKDLYVEMIQIGPCCMTFHAFLNCD